MCSLLALKVLMESKFAFFPLYQLAYALETQLELVQVDVFIATIVLLPFELAHFGMDYFSIVFLLCSLMLMCCRYGFHPSVRLASLHIGVVFVLFSILAGLNQER
ncbi:hypothetical protein GQ600_17570 [Phytophthora cactorum]|nr:hypothetical protein GQ600_17570 [Phytophthora cactorum]